MLSLLTLAADRSPVLCLVDDAHWLDGASIDALLFVARRLAADPAAMLIAAREGEGAFLEAPGLPEIRLEGLGPEDCERLLRALRGGPVPRSTVERLVRATAGNPLALVELPSLVGDEGLASSEPFDEPLPVGPQISRAFARRIAALPPDA